MDRDACIALVIDIEGGYSNDPRDPGGPTNHGITQRYLNGRRPEATISLPDDVRDLTVAQATWLYQTDQWTVLQCDQLPPAVALVAFDCAVNQGTPTAARLLQASVAVPQDGVVGPATLAAVLRLGATPVAQELAIRRALRYITSGNVIFIGGWIRRLFRVYTAALVGN